MKITKRQLNKIITESLDIQINELKTPKQVAQEFKDKNLTRKIGKNLKAWNGSTGQRKEELEKLLNDQKDELKIAYDAGAFDKMNLKQKAAAEKLLSILETVLENPTPQKIPAAEAELAAITNKIEDDPSPEPTEPTPWNPDPDPKSDWEYQVRECIWYTRKQETTKEYKLGHASGKPLEKGGKFFNSIVALNKAYPDLVKDCDPVKKKRDPKPKPKSGDGGKYDQLAKLYGKYKGVDFGADDSPTDQDRKLSEDIKSILYSLQAAESQINKGRGFNISSSTAINQLEEFGKILDFLQALKPGATDQAKRQAASYARYEIFRSGSGNAQAAQKALGTVNSIYTELNRISTLYLKDKNNSDIAKLGSRIAQEIKEVNSNGARHSLFNESLSRGALYRRRYYGRY